MTRNIRLLIILTIVVVAVAITALFKPSLFGDSLLCSSQSEAPTQAPLCDSIRQLLSQQLYLGAGQLIAEGKGEAHDSVEYYQYELLAGKLFFHTMQADSLLAITRRLQHFLQRQQHSADVRLLELAVKAESARGVYEVKAAGRMDSAVFHYQRALDMTTPVEWMNGKRLILLTNLADAYRFMGRYDRSVDFFQQAMSLADSIGNTDSDTQICINMGIASAYSAMQAFDESRQWWQKVELLRPQMQPDDLFQYLNNRGNDYFLQGNYAESLKCFLSLDSLVSAHADMLWEKMFGRVNLSHVYIKLGSPEKAVPLLEETEQFFTRQHQPLPLYYIATQRIELAQITGNMALAQRLCDESETPAFMIPEQILLRQRALMQFYRQTGDWKRFAEVQNDYQQLRDSIMSDKTKMQVSVVLLRHDHERNMLDKQRQLEEKELSFRWAIALLVAAAVVIFLLVVIGVQLKKQQQMKELGMRNRIAGLRMATVRNRITPHFMSNALSAEIVSQMDGKEADLDSLVQLLHRGIEMTGNEQNTLGEELEFINFYCSVESRTLGPDFVYSTEMAPDVDPERVVLPAMFVQILVENALKHGLKPKPRQQGQQRTVLVRAERSDKGTLVQVVDNGLGLPDGTKPKVHTGLKVVQQTMQLLNEQNQEQMTFSIVNRPSSDGQTGCCASIYLPDNYQYTL